MSYICEYCQTPLASEKSLYHHQRHAAFCIRIREEQTKSIDESLRCEFCKKVFSSKYYKESHTIKCKVYLNKFNIYKTNKMEQRINFLYDKNELLLREKNDIIEKFRSQIQALHREIDSLEKCKIKIPKKKVNDENIVLYNSDVMLDEVSRKLTDDILKNQGVSGVANLIGTCLSSYIRIKDGSRKKIVFNIEDIPELECHASIPSSTGIKDSSSHILKRCEIIRPLIINEMKNTKNTSFIELLNIQLKNIESVIYECNKVISGDTNTPLIKICNKTMMNASIKSEINSRTNSITVN